MIEIVRVDGTATVQDLGRPGYAYLGVGRSGAADRGALRLANRLVGNAASAAGIEIDSGGLTIRIRHAVTAALTGAVCPGELGWGAAVTVPAGVNVHIGAPVTGLRSYLALRGGIDVAPVLGSRSTDLLGGLGPNPLQPGDLLSMGSAAEAAISGEIVGPSAPPERLRVVAGPRADWFTDGALATLIETAWLVSKEADRVGTRLRGVAIRRSRAEELATEPTLPGAIQIPPSGQPILLGPDAPVTGGYPVIAVVVDADLDATGQLRPGDSVRFRL